MDGKTSPAQRNRKHLAAATATKFETRFYATGKSMASPRAPIRTGALPPRGTAAFCRVATGREVVDVGSSPAAT